MVAVTNPAAVYCASLGGTYDSVAGTCTIGGVVYNAWSLYYASQDTTTDMSSMMTMIMGMMIPLIMMVMMMKMMTGMFAQFES